MMVKKSDENSRALALNETVGENCFLARTTPRPVSLRENIEIFIVWLPLEVQSSRGEVWGFINQYDSATS